jgi:protease IV
MSLYNYLKNAFLILILIQIAPFLFKSIITQYTALLEIRTQVGLLEMKGLISDSSAHTKQLTTFFQNPEIKSILIKMDCRGTAAGTGYAIYHEIAELKKEYPKFVVVLVENMCTSGGYWIACAADHIIAPSAALIGSIGTSFPYLFQFKEFIEQYKIHYQSMTAGKYKSIADPFVDISNDEKAILQAVLDDSYQQFTMTVAHARKLSLDSVNSWANGKIFTGQQALNLGLIDEIGSLHNAIKVIKEQTVIVGTIEWVKPPVQKNWFTTLFSTSDDTSNDSFIETMCGGICNVLEQRYVKQIQ